MLANSRNLEEASPRSNLLLLDAVSGEGANLREHVLARVEYAIAGSQSGFPVAANVPSKAYAWLELLVLVRKEPGRREVWIAQVRAIRGLGWRDGRIRKVLRIPTQAVVQSEVTPNLPAILTKQGNVFIGDAGLAGLVERLSRRSRTML